MPLTIILNRMWHNRRVLLVLLLAMCLVTGFFALGPLYLRAVAQSGLLYQIDHSQPGAFNLLLQNPTRLSLDSRAVLDTNLGNLVKGVELITRPEGIFCNHTVPAAKCIEQGIYQGYLPVGLSRMKDRFDLAEGRWPEVLPAGGQFQAEAVVTREVADAPLGKISVGSSFNLRGTNGHDIQITVVGIVEPHDLSDPFWNALRFVTKGQLTDVTENFQRFDFGLVIPEAAYDNVIAPYVLTKNQYEWYIETDTDALRSDSIDSLGARLAQTETTLRLQYPDIGLLGGLRSIIQQFLDAAATSEGTVILISATTLLLLLYQLMMIVSLILERQSKEWSVIASRGGSTFQVTLTQFVTVAIPGLIAIMGGPLFAQAILLGLQHVGPSSSILAAVSVPALTMPTNSYLLSGIAGVATVFALVLPALPLARRSILLLKQSVSRPPLHPAWAHYYLDFILLIVGAGFLLRMYVLAGGDGIGGFIQDPASFIRLISAAQNAEVLHDPFNLAGAALVIAGFALLWVRIFPLVMRLVGTVLRRLNGLVAPLALWNIEREPGHYAQLVLLLIGTLAIGTASLALAATHDRSAWGIARQSNGAEVRLNLNPTEALPDQDATHLPDVTSSVSLMHLVTTPGLGEKTVTMYGIDPASFTALHPETADSVAPLRQIQPLELPGVVLPDDAATITMAVYAEPLEDGKPLHTRLELQLVDTLGVTHPVAMTSDDETMTGKFVTYKAVLPDNYAFRPWRLDGIRFPSEAEGEKTFSARIFLDDLTSINPAGQATVVQDFESRVLPEWTERNQQRATGTFAIPTSAQAAQGTFSFRIDYNVAERGAQVVIPSLAINIPPPQAVPVIVSPAFAQYYGTRSDARRAFKAGDTGKVSLPVPEGVVEMSFTVMGVTADWPSSQPNELFFITLNDFLRPLLNTVGKPTDFFNTNEIWLTTAAQQPSTALEQAVSTLPGMTGVTYAWDLYEQIRRDPLPNAVTGTLFVVFWLSLILGLLDFTFYLAMTAQRRALSFAALRAMGWNARKLWAVMSIEQIALVIPALVIGIGLGWLTAYLLLPLLALIGQAAPVFPLADVSGMALILLAAFATLLGVVAVILQRMSVSQVLRLGEE